MFGLVGDIPPQEGQPTFTSIPRNDASPLEFDGVIFMIVVHSSLYLSLLFLEMLCCYSSATLRSLTYFIKDVIPNFK